MSFTVHTTDSGSAARQGTLVTAHGSIETPIFMPVGTQATIKTLDHNVLSAQTDVQIILCNTYHLYLRPGHEVISEAGGLHNFMGWQMPVLTDSGGYQVYSLSQMRKISEEGARFRSHIDGSSHLFTPERAIDVQQHLGADIIMAFDECTPYPCEKAYARQSMHLTHRWLDRCIAHHSRDEPLHGYRQILAPIVQGGTYTALRAESAEYVARKDLEINAIGGLSVGEPHEEMYAVTDAVCRILPADKPRYLMGVGTPQNILECISLGVDMFDCVMPTRNARHGLLYTYSGTINIRNEKWKKDFSPIDPEGSAWSKTFSKAYLRHLVMAKESFGASLCTLHNLHFFLDLVSKARAHITAGTYTEWKRKTSPVLDTRI